MSDTKPENTVAGSRIAQAHVDPEFLERWSPRAFRPEPVPPDTLESLFEAARWAPSCYNEQPWLFLYARSPEDLGTYVSLLAEPNQRWARHAPVLAFLFARRVFTRNGRPNRWASFDTGAAWMSLALQARRLGLYTHAMGGFEEDRVYQTLGVSREDYEALAAIAIGHRADPGQLPEDLAAMERPSPRKDLASVAREGRSKD